MGFIFKNENKVEFVGRYLCFFKSYNKDEKLEFNYKRACGLWLIVVVLIISLATLIGGNKSSICKYFALDMLSVFSQ